MANQNPRPYLSERITNYMVFQNALMGQTEFSTSELREKCKVSRANVLWNTIRKMESRPTEFDIKILHFGGKGRDDPSIVTLERFNEDG